MNKMEIIKNDATGPEQGSSVGDEVSHEGFVREQREELVRTIDAIGAMQSGAELSVEQKQALVDFFDRVMAKKDPVATMFDQDYEFFQVIDRTLPGFIDRIKSGDKEIEGLIREFRREIAAREVVYNEKAPGAKGFGELPPKSQRMLQVMTARLTQEFVENFRNDFASEEELQAYLQEIRVALAELEFAIPKEFIPGTKEYRFVKYVADPICDVVDGVNAAIIFIRERLKKIQQALIEGSDREEEIVSGDKKAA